jgi:hypothetical protein
MIAELIPLALFVLIISGICWLSLRGTRRMGE